MAGAPGRRFGVATVGVMAADVLVRPVNRWPESGRLLLVDEIEVRSGGLAHTSAVTLGKLGVPAAAVGRVGDDIFGTFLVDALQEHGVTSYVRRDDQAGTSVTVVAVAGGGERSFFHLIGANGRLVSDDVGDDLLAETAVLHLAGFFLLPALDGEPAAHLLRRAKEAGCLTSLDVAWDAQGRWMEVLEPCLPHLDILFGNRDELGSLAGTTDATRIAASLREVGPETVAVKLGEGGAYVDGTGWRGYVPAYAVEVVDTTGAGDAFCGGFLAARLMGWDLHQTTRFANAAGALCVTAVGGATGVRPMEATLRFVQRTPTRSIL